MAAQPPPDALLQSGWFPHVLRFYWRVAQLWVNAGGFGFNSWFRTPEDNRDAGGDAESQHLLALAMDLQVGTARVRHVIDEARRLGLHAFPISDRAVHVQEFPAGALARAGVQFPS